VEHLLQGVLHVLVNLFPCPQAALAAASPTIGQGVAAGRLFLLPLLLLLPPQLRPHGTPELQVLLLRQQTQSGPCLQQQSQAQHMAK
jgi:hypothetical protein